MIYTYISTFRRLLITRICTGFHYSSAVNLFYASQCHLLIMNSNYFFEILASKFATKVGSVLSGPFPRRSHAVAVLNKSVISIR